MLVGHFSRWNVGLIGAVFIVTSAQVWLFIGLHDAADHRGDEEESSSISRTPQSAPPVVVAQPAVSFLSPPRSALREKKWSSTTRANERNNLPSEASPAAAPAAFTNVSACLLIKDDNDLLNEWLAYHYHSLNLRQIIVAVDPTSTQSPSDLFEKWRRWTNLDVREWTDRDFMPAVFLKEGRPPQKRMNKLDLLRVGAADKTDEEIRLVHNHNYRQGVFLAKCMQSFRRDGLSWVTHIVSGLLLPVLI